MTKCAQCHHAAAEDAKYCAECGAALAADAPDARDPHWARYVEFLHDRRVRRARAVRRALLLGGAAVAAVALVVTLRLTHGSLWPSRLPSPALEAPRTAEAPEAQPPQRAEAPPAVEPPPEAQAAPPVELPRTVELPPAPARERSPAPAKPREPAPDVAPRIAARPVPPPIVRSPVPAPFESRVPPSALPSIVGRDDALAVGDLVISVHSEPRVDSRGRVVDYTVRLAQRNGAPVTDAQVALRGETSDGATMEARLDHMSTAGVYASAVIVPASGLHRLSLRITRPDTALELPIVPAPPS